MLLPLFRAQKKCIRIMFGDSEAFTNKFKTCVRARPINCEILPKGHTAVESTKQQIKPCSICTSLKKVYDKKVWPHRCQQLGVEFYSRESTKPLFKAHNLMTVHNLYRFRCMMETIKAIRNHLPISIYGLFHLSDRKENLFITPDPSHNFVYNGAKLWNKFFEQSNDLRGKLGSLSSIKSQLKRSLLEAQFNHDAITWNDTNFTNFCTISGLHNA